MLSWWEATALAFCTKHQKYATSIRWILTRHQLLLFLPNTKSKSWFFVCAYTQVQGRCPFEIFSAHNSTIKARRYLGGVQLLKKIYFYKIFFLILLRHFARVCFCRLFMKNVDWYFSLKIDLSIKRSWKSKIACNNMCIQAQILLSFWWSAY